MRKYLNYIVIGMTLMLIIGCGKQASWGKGGADKGKTSAPPAIVYPVEVGAPTRGSISDYLQTTARIEAERRVEITAEGTGKCLTVLVEEGDTVKQGDVLADLDKEEAKASLQQAEVQVRQQKAEYERSKSGHEQGIISDVDYDVARFTYEQGQANLELQRVQFDNLTIRAPIDGIITERTIQVGMLVSSGTPVYKMVDPSSYMLVITPHERDLPKLGIGQVAEITLDSLPDVELSAKVRRINPSVDPNTGTVKVTLDFDRSILGSLRQSAFARVRLIMETRDNALLIQKDVLREENARSYVYVAEPLTEPSETKSEATHIARRIEVQKGFEDGSFVEILDGIDDGVELVTIGQHNLKPGAQVKVTTPEREMAANIDMPIDEALARAQKKRDELEKEGVQQKPGMHMFKE